MASEEDPSVTTLLYEAFVDRKLGVIIELLRRDSVDPNILLPGKDATLLHLAAAHENIKYGYGVARVLLRRYGADPNVRSQIDRATPVHIAVTYNHLKVLKLLLESGGDSTNVYDSNGRSPLTLSVAEQIDDCALLIMKHNLSITDTEEDNDDDSDEEKIIITDATTITTYDIDSSDLESFITATTTNNSSNNNYTSNDNEDTTSLLNRRICVPDHDSDSTTISYIYEVYKIDVEEEHLTLFEKRLVSPIPPPPLTLTVPPVPTTTDDDDDDDNIDKLRRELTLYGYNPGPVTVTTKQVYARKLSELKKLKVICTPPALPTLKRAIYSFELEKALQTTNWPDNLSPYIVLEEQMSEQFIKPTRGQKWREGLNKSSFIYVLLDPRITQNLPIRATNESLSFSDRFRSFVDAIIYVGKGKRNRPYAHLYEALGVWQRPNSVTNTTTKKVKRILEIWQANCGIVCLSVFHNVIPVEAYTREAAILSALQRKNVCNIKAGDFYGRAATWSKRDQKLLGVFLLYKAMNIFLNEGERQLYPADIN